VLFDRLFGGNDGWLLVSRVHAIVCELDELQANAWHTVVRLAYVIINAKKQA
jgi:hypothetical protein